MTRSKATEAAEVRRVLTALGAARLPDQLDPETVAAAVALDDHYASAKAPAVLPSSWATLTDRHLAAEADKAGKA